MDLVKQLLEQHGGGLVQQLSGKLGFDAGQAQRFVPAAVTRVVDVLKGGKLDLGALLGGAGAPQAVAAEVDTAALAQDAGVDPAKARAGLESLVPSLLDGLKQQAGGAQGLGALLGGQAGGLLGKASSLAGGLFKK